MTISPNVGRTITGLVVGAGLGALVAASQDAPKNTSEQALSGVIGGAGVAFTGASIALAAKGRDTGLASIVSGFALASGAVGLLKSA